MSKYTKYHIYSLAQTWGVIQRAVASSLLSYMTGGHIGGHTTARIHNIPTNLDDLESVDARETTCTL